MLGFPARFCTLIPSVLILALSACSGLLPAPAPTPSPALTPTASPTIMWFPATNTPTPFPTAVSLPTGELRPGLGELIFSDPFDDPSFWPVGKEASASIIVERGRITLTAQPKSLVLSVRTEPMLSDFYAEINAHLSLCRAKDAYGMLFRAISNLDYYRFAVNCSGQVRLERVHSGEAAVIQDWLPSGDAPMGAPGEVKLGVWMAGTEMRFYLNDRFQFSTRDAIYSSGTIGVYVQSGDTGGETVSFSDLNVQRVSYVSPTPSATPSRTPTP